MNTTTCFIVDDEQHCIDVIANHIKATPGLELIGTQLDSKIAIQQFSEHKISPDITFLDVQMPGISGIHLADLISNRTQVIFTTAYPEYAVNAFEKDAVDFLLKPVFYERFSKAVAKAREQIALRQGLSSQENTKDFVFIKSEGKGKVVRINFKDILYIESKLNYISIVTDKENHITHSTMKEIEGNLPSNFIRAHKSFVINIPKIKKVEFGKIIFWNKDEISIGRAYKQNFIQAINDNMLNARK